MAAAPTHLNHLYRGTFLFGLACGISLALTSLFLDAAGYTKQDIGILALFFAAGLVLFALPVGAVIRRFSGKRTLSVMLIGYAVAVALFPYMPSFEAIAAVRFFDGVFSVGVWVSSETILLSRTDKEHKAHLTSLYAIWLASGYVVGPLLALGLIQVLSLGQAFLVSGAFGLLSAIYLHKNLPADLDAARRTAAVEAARQDAEDPKQDPSIAAARLGGGSILWRIKTSCFAAFSYGYFQAAVVLFLPLFLIESKHIERDKTVILPGLFCFGMLLCSNLAGRIADRVGHLRVVTLLSILGTACVLGFVFLDSYWLMCVAVFGAGATFASMSPVALALTGVVIQQQDLSRANSIYNVFYATGMLIGPPVASLIFQRAGGVAMLYHLGALWVAFILFSIVFMGDDPASGKTRVKEPSWESAADP